MTRQRILRPAIFAGFLAALPLPIAAPALAQEVAPKPTPNADRLAAQMRILATDPRNVEALLIAGEMSARLNDPSAAAGFFARAQALAPGNPRVQAGQGMVMVRMEKPGEALRLFAAAERAGVVMRPYASDRGLAYDLVGAQGHAQREHRLAMQDDPDDDTVRRYALSLGISGRTDEAMTVLDPLLRRSDRGAWRARAFILAMNNDAAGADKIAASMMGGFGSALSPFFRRLPTLSPADKAFAVHFGELRRTPARIADAQAAPPLPPLAQEPPVRVARVDTPRAAEPVRPRRRTEVRSAREASERARERQEAEQLAARKQAEDAEARRIADARAAAQRETERQAELQRQAEAQRLADARAAQQRAEAERIAREAEQRQLAEAAAAKLATPQPATRPDPEPPKPAPVVVARAPDPAPRPGFAPDGAMVLPAETRGTPPRIGAEDNVIARIVSGITIPASELGVAPMPGRDEPEAVADAAPPPVVAAAPPEAEAKPEPVAKKPEPKAKPAPKPKPKVDPAKTDPARYWVQVAGGANVKALPREWKRLAGEAPAEFRGKQAWTTPLRFTNRLLAGPFKSEGAAQDFVNMIAKKGLSAFAWTSEAGQKIEKLDVK